MNLRPSGWSALQSEVQRTPAWAARTSSQFAINQARLIRALTAIDLLAWIRTMLLRDERDLAQAEPKNLRSWLLHGAGRLVRGRPQTSSGSQMDFAVATARHVPAGRQFRRPDHAGPSTDRSAGSEARRPTGPSVRLPARNHPRRKIITAIALGPVNTPARLCRHLHADRHAAADAGRATRGIDRYRSAPGRCRRSAVHGDWEPDRATRRNLCGIPNAAQPSTRWDPAARQWDS